MLNETRQKFNAYLQQQASINGIDFNDAKSTRFSVTPSVQQTLEDKIMHSSEFLQKINYIGVTEQEGQTIGLGVSRPVASRTNTQQTDRATKDVHSLSDNKYRCEQNNFDTHINYALLDAWSKFPDFQLRLSNQIVKQIALDRIMIGMNGTSVAETSDFNSNPNLEDVNIGWLEKVRQDAPGQHIKEIETDSGEVKVGESEEFKNLDALVQDAVNSLLEPWYANSSDLVVLVGRKLLSDKYFPIINKAQPNTETIAGQILVSQKRIGNLPAVQVPFMPENSLLITQFDNLSFYYQIASSRRQIIDNPRRDRIETYQSSNDAYVVEDYGCTALVDNIILS